MKVELFRARCFECDKVLSGFWLEVENCQTGWQICVVCFIRLRERARVVLEQGMNA